MIDLRAPTIISSSSPTLVPPADGGAPRRSGRVASRVGRIAVLLLALFAESAAASTGSSPLCNKSVVSLAEHRSGVLIRVACATSSRIAWTESKAETEVASKVFFAWGVNNKNWGSYSESVLSVTCRGVGETATFTFSRFDCAIVEGHPGYTFGSHVFPDRPVAQGHIAVYVTGPAAFRWKVL